MPDKHKEVDKGESVLSPEESEMEHEGENIVLKEAENAMELEEDGVVGRTEELCDANCDKQNRSREQDSLGTSSGNTSGIEPNKKKEEIVEALLRHARYLLTLKGRPPFRLAGIEMYERFKGLSLELDSFIAVDAEPRLIKLQHGLKTALQVFADDYSCLRQGGDWLKGISTILDNEEKPHLSGEQVKEKVFAYLSKMKKEAKSSTCAEFAEQMEKTTRNYEKGLFHTYDIEGLPRTNNILESGFRDYKRGLLRSTGQVGATRRLIARNGAWEILGKPNSWEDLVKGIALVNQEEFVEERERVRQQRERFQLHTRSVKFVKKGIEKLKKLWQDIKSKEKVVYA